MTGPRVELGATRCPYCHAQVEAAERAQARVCEACLARHHAECWAGACASCGGARALGVASDVAGERFETLKAVANWGYVASFALCMAAMPIASAISPPSAGTDPLPVFMLPLGLCGSLSVLMWALNSYDAVLRRSRDPAFRASGAWALALASPLTGGITGFCYFMFHGRHALPGSSAPAPRPAASPAHEKEPEAARPAPEREKA
jgi:hypothetical protein